mmetsp:Transcript_324/g.1266  ORF Transcript_324/g.1266 Transcript_324/m.1266 type:complete len:237 (+) Transcript_324:1845-2555(+)
MNSAKRPLACFCRCAWIECAFCSSSVMCFWFVTALTIMSRVIAYTSHVVRAMSWQFRFCENKTDISPTTLPAPETDSTESRSPPLPPVGLEPACGESALLLLSRMVPAPSEDTTATFMWPRTMRNISVPTSPMLQITCPSWNTRGSRRGARASRRSTGMWLNRWTLARLAPVTGNTLGMFSRRCWNATSVTAARRSAGRLLSWLKKEARSKTHTRHRVTARKDSIRGSSVSSVISP